MSSSHSDEETVSILEGYVHAPMAEVGFKPIPQVSLTKVPILIVSEDNNPSNARMISSQKVLPDHSNVLNYNNHCEWPDIVISTPRRVVQMYEPQPVVVMAPVPRQQLFQPMPMVPDTAITSQLPEASVPFMGRVFQTPKFIKPLRPKPIVAERNPKAIKRRPLNKNTRRAVSVPSLGSMNSVWKLLEYVINRNPTHERYKTKVACTNCHKQKLGCNMERPCKRCVKTGKAAYCVDRLHIRARKLARSHANILMNSNTKTMDPKAKEPKSMKIKSTSSKRTRSKAKASKNSKESDLAQRLQRELSLSKREANARQPSPIPAKRQKVSKAKKATKSSKTKKNTSTVSRKHWTKAAVSSSSGGTEASKAAA